MARLQGIIKHGAIRIASGFGYSFFVKIKSKVSIGHVLGHEIAHRSQSHRKDAPRWDAAFQSGHKFLAARRHDQP
jgi:hypothetical protein